MCIYIYICICLNICVCVYIYIYIRMSMSGVRKAAPKSVNSIDSLRPREHQSNVVNVSKITNHLITMNRINYPKSVVHYCFSEIIPKSSLIPSWSELPGRLIVGLGSSFAGSRHRAACGIQQLV